MFGYALIIIVLLLKPSGLFGTKKGAEELDFRKYLNWIFFIVACLAPILLTDRYHRHLLVLSGIFAILALSLDIIMGYLGELSLGHAAFFGLGAYVSALLSLNFNLSF